MTEYNEIEEDRFFSFIYDREVENPALAFTTEADEGRTVLNRSLVTTNVVTTARSKDQNDVGRGRSEASNTGQNDVAVGQPNPCLVRANLVDAGRSRNTRELVNMYPGTLTEYKKRRITYDTHGWDRVNNYPDPGRLADAGFYYEGYGDNVICQYCKLELCEWEPGDNPKTEHRKYSPNCRYIRQFD